MRHELVDICVNLAHDAFRKERDAIVARAVEAGVTRMMVTGSNEHDNPRCLALADAYPDHLWATVGVHPHHAREWTPGSSDRLRELATHDKVRAIGEAGLDFNRNYSSPEDQERAFEAQLAVASELGMPVFLHERDAHQRFLQILSPYLEHLPRAVVHCFTGDAHELERYLEMGLHVGITGWICDDRRGLHLREIVGRIPSDRLMLETDAPYLLPRDLRPRPHGRRNEPAFLPHVLNTVAAARGRSPDLLAAETTRTACYFYGLP